MTDVYVSLTTVASRLTFLSRVIQSILDQTLPPSKIILNISERPYGFDAGVRPDQLPPEVARASRQGMVRINTCDNMGPYTKLIPTLQLLQGQNYIVITADDDTLYPPRWIEGLVGLHGRHDCVTAYRCRKMLHDHRGFAPYAQWPFVTMPDDVDQYRPSPSLDILPTGRGGILYHSSYFDDLQALDDLRHLAPWQDDIAFRLHLLRKEIPVVAAHFQTAGATQLEFGRAVFADRLWLRNRESSGELTPNDHAIAAIVDHFRKHGIDLPLWPDH